MKETTSWKLRVVYGLLLIIVCGASFVFASLSAWKYRTDGSAITLWGLSALFFGGTAVMLIAQGFTRWRYRTTAAQIAFSPFKWGTATDEMLELVLEGRQEASIGDNYHGRIHDVHMYVFNYSRGPAWWKKTWTMVTSRLNGSAPPESLARSIEQRIGADARICSGWLIVRSRHRVAAKDLKPWLSSIAALLEDADSDSSSTSH